MTSELLTIQILSAKSILNVNNNGTNRTDHEIRTHHNAQSGESRTLCSKHNIYIFKKSSQNYNQTARGRRVTDAFLLSSLRLKIFMNHNIGRKSEAGGTLFCYKPSCFSNICLSWYSHANKPVNMIIYI